MNQTILFKYDINVSNNNGNSATIIPTSLYYKLANGRNISIQELLYTFGSNLLFNYNVNTSGLVSAHDCFAIHKLSGYLTYINQQKSKTFLLASTNQAPNTPSLINTNNIIHGQPWITEITTLSSGCDGSGCGCQFTNYGGWKNIKLSITIIPQLADACKNPINNTNYQWLYDYICHIAVPIAPQLSPIPVAPQLPPMPMAPQLPIRPPLSSPTLLGKQISQFVADLDTDNYQCSWNQCLFFIIIIIIIFLIIIYLLKNKQLEKYFS